jgi:HAD superfamily hydrolase (TIGR01490 family)
MFDTSIDDKISSRRIVIFDLDGTLIRQQSQSLFLSFLRRRGQIGLIPYVKLVFWFICYRIGVVKQPEKVMKYAFSYLRGRSVEELSLTAKLFADEVIIPAVSDAARRLVDEHYELGDILLLVSNSLEPIAAQVAFRLGIHHCIATRLETQQGFLTGELQGTAVYGFAKAIAIKGFIEQHGLSLRNSVAYCDHDSDLPVLEMVDCQVAVNPVRRLLQHAKQLKWQIMYL